MSNYHSQMNNIQLSNVSTVWVHTGVLHSGHDLRSGLFTQTCTWGQ